MIKDYQTFKITVKSAIEYLNATGLDIKAKRWQKQSVYQKRRYKDEYVFPEVWVYGGNSSLGAVINGEETPDSIVDTAQLIRSTLF